MPKTKVIREIPFEQIERTHQLAAYWWGKKWCPSVVETADGYQIRILRRDTRLGRWETTTYDFFYLANDGLILTAPRGYARDYKPGRVTGLAEAVVKYAPEVRP